MNFELCSKPFLPQSGMEEFVQHEGMVVTHVFTPAGLGQLNLFSSTLGWSDRGSKWYKLSIGWYRLEYRCVLPISFKHAWAVWKAPQKKERKKERKKASKQARKKERNKERKKEIKKERKKDHLNMDYGVSVLGGSPIGYAGFMSCFKVQGNFLLLCSSNNFVGHSYNKCNKKKKDTTLVLKSKHMW